MERSNSTRRFPATLLPSSTIQVGTCGHCPGSLPAAPHFRRYPWPGHLALFFLLLLTCPGLPACFDSGEDKPDSGSADSPNASTDSTDVLDTAGTASDQDSQSFEPDDLDEDLDGFTPAEGDCDDTDPDIYPGHRESCDGIDSDCDGSDDFDGWNQDSTWEGDIYPEMSSGCLWYLPDNDDDGFGNADRARCTCEDLSSSDLVDTTWLPSLDDEGESLPVDCNDNCAAVNPDALEICDGADNDCDDLVDELEDSTDSDYLELVGALTWYLDADSDGYGDESEYLISCSDPSCSESDSEPGGADTACPPADTGDPDQDCSNPDTGTAGVPAYVLHDDGRPFDCDDTDPEVNPAADELCRDEIDNDCDGLVNEDDAADSHTWYFDADGDGSGDPDYTRTSCTQPEGYISEGGDCDDTDDDVYPGAPEYCNELDDDCDGEIDEGDAVDAETWYADSDADSFGDPDSSTSACLQPSGHVADQGDCDDDDPLVFPGSDEFCDGIDNDCDGEIDEDDALDASWWYQDSDMDGHGQGSSLEVACYAPHGYVDSSDDCDDTRADVYPGADEICDGVDNDCDDLVDDSDLDVSGRSHWYRDFDGDGYGSSDSGVDEACINPDGYVSNDDDCDDTDAETNPSASEVCDGKDNDCDGYTDDEDSSTTGFSTWYRDADGDGYGDFTADSALACDAPLGFVGNHEDCDDTRSDVCPSCLEYCDESDNDCDGTIDEDVTTTFYRDRDGDGFGDTDLTQEACSSPEGYTSQPEDCDDTDPSANPGATESCDELDNDCDGVVDEGVTSTFYADADSDGYGDPYSSTEACDAAPGYVADSGDCDDGATSIHPGAGEVCDGVDNDCDGLVDDDDDLIGGLLTWYRDLDDDGYGDPLTTMEQCEQPDGYLSDNNDCDDSDPTINPEASELCDGSDNDCDGAVDEDDAIDAAIWFLDADGDGYAGAEYTREACLRPDSYFSSADDCNDAAADIHPGAEEVCDDLDNDCDGAVDDDDDGLSGGVTWYQDRDGDGYGDPASTIEACNAPDGFVANLLDCNDLSSAISPAADEICDGLDNDCDGAVDDDDDVLSDPYTWYADHDGDEFGDPAIQQGACEQPPGFVADDNDCDDSNPAVNPSASEYCDDVDNDCDGLTDESDSLDATTWFLDADGDGYAGNDGSTVACTAPDGYQAYSLDCDDASASIHPGADEACDGIDNDCDGAIDDDDIDSVLTGTTTWYLDRDGDGYGDIAHSTEACQQPDGYSSTDTDCDDFASSISPAADEVCDGVDNDCDGAVDDDDVVMDPMTWYADTDLDGYGDPAVTMDSCYSTEGWLADSSDCDDGDSAVNPGADEYCDGIDNDCDGDIDESSALDASTWYMDLDGDGFGGGDWSTMACELPSGYSANSADCDDGDASVNPSAAELCDDGIDNDCDGDIDESDAIDAPTWYRDLDSDGYIDLDSSTRSCLQPDGYLDSTAEADCQDEYDYVHPGVLDYYAAPYTTPAGGSSYDYNCDGNEEPLYGVACQDGSCVDFSAEGFAYMATAPECGNTGGAVADGNCFTGELGCSYSSPTPLVQVCR